MRRRVKILWRFCAFINKCDSCGDLSTHRDADVALILVPLMQARSSDRACMALSSATRSFSAIGLGSSHHRPAPRLVNPELMRETRASRLAVRTKHKLSQHSSLAVTKPMPLLAPVTTANFPDRSHLVIISVIPTHLFARHHLAENRESTD